MAHVDYLLFFRLRQSLCSELTTYLSTKRFDCLPIQLIFLGIGIIIAIVIICMDYERYAGDHSIILLRTIGLLVAVLFTTSVYGAKGWFRSADFPVPAELAKLAILLMVSKRMQDVNGEINNFKNFMMVPPMRCTYGLTMPSRRLTMVSFFIV